MPTLAELDALCVAMPQATRNALTGDRPEWLVGGKSFVRHREQRRDALDPDTGERLADVLMFRTSDLAVKEQLLADPPDVLFTTPHFKGYPAVLSRIGWLDRWDADLLEDVVVEAWLAVAPKRVANAWLAERSG